MVARPSVRPSVPATSSRRRLWLAAGLVALGVTVVSASDNWPRFRGERAGVVDDDPALPDAWSDTDNVVWKRDLPGLGWSSPIVWGDVIFVTSAISSVKGTPPKPGLDLLEGQAYAFGNVKDPTSTAVHTWVLYAIDFKSGKVRWTSELRHAVPVEPKHLKNTFASETPVTDGTRVYVYIGGAGVLYAVDFNGTVVWSRDVAPRDPGPSAPSRPAAAADSDAINMGAAASPALHNGRIYIVNDHKGPPEDRRHDVGEWFLAAFSARTGEEIWRAHHVKEKFFYGWSTPFVWENALRTEIITASDNHVRSYDPDGTLLWELEGLSVSTTPTPFAAHGLLFVSSGLPGGFRPVYAIRPGASGDISLKPEETSNAHVVWSHRQLATYIPSGLVYGDYLYSLYSQGFFQSNEARTGKPVYGRQRIDRESSTFTASPWAYNGKIFALNEEGDTYVIEAGPEFKVLRKNSLGQMAIATPAIVRGSLIVRTLSSLWRIAKTSQ